MINTPKLQIRNNLYLRTLHYLPALLFLLLLYTGGRPAYAQASYRVLFLGNSYTYFNNMPQMVQNVAASAGDNLIFDSNTPGGYQLMDHLQDPVSQAKIMAGGWDYVVIQGQSREPITQSTQFNNGGLALYNLIKQYNPCAEVVTYMTWGRRNGDEAYYCWAYPPMCTYEGMDSTLRRRYITFTTVINGETSPVSVVWNDLRQNHPDIELYQADASHPSLAGSYAAACCFYTSLFKKDPTLTTYNPGLSAATVSAIKSTTKTRVFDSLSQWDFKKAPVSRFRLEIGPGTNEVVLAPLNPGVHQTYSWDFGDGATSSASNPTHSYTADGTYTISLTTTNCNLQGQHNSFSDTVIQFCSHTPVVYSSKPWLCNYDTLRTDAADAYQWYMYGVPLPETGQILPDFARYGISGFAVRSTLNGCSELSALYTAMPEFSGYYFDAIGDPCAGDTVAFAILHINGPLSGSEQIRWFRNQIPLPAMNNKDTLLITEAGIYECMVTNPNTLCPQDTTYYRVEYDCGSIGMLPQETKAAGIVFPNPASGTINIRFNKSGIQGTLELYDAGGQQLRSVNITGDNMPLDISGLPAGFYYLRLKNSGLPAMKFMKL